MSIEMYDPTADTCVAIEKAIVGAIEGAKVEVRGMGGHFEIQVISSVFAGKNTLQKQRLVYSAITPLMSGANPPVHAIDKLETLESA